MTESQLKQTKVAQKVTLIPKPKGIKPSRMFGKVFVHCTVCGTRYSIKEEEFLCGDTVYLCKNCDLTNEANEFVEEDQALELGRRLYYGDYLPNYREVFA